MTTWTTSGTCTDCGARATCRYDWGAGMRHACAAHDPLRPGLTATVRVPPFYQSLPRFPVTVTAPVCTCPPCWGGLCPPPACPAHGQTEMIQVRC
jgi:hypothetical protein